VAREEFVRRIAEAWLEGQRKAKEYLRLSEPLNRTTWSGEEQAMCPSYQGATRRIVHAFGASQ
jgi:hypothetical protein